jgi:aerobic-type carbon monoxide dehydrogenase small subunit (CoxS/CutS family)
MSAGLALDFTVNGKRWRVRVPPMKRLLDVLREDCGLTGTKEGCGEGECGACTVLMDGVPVNSCLVPAVQAVGVKIVTVEGLAKGPALSVLQRAFVERGGTQCGSCTPGILVTAHALLQRARGRVPGDGEVRVALAGNLCRCTGYQMIVNAVRAAARETQASARKRAGRTAKPVARAKVKSARTKARPAQTKTKARTAAVVRAQVKPARAKAGVARRKPKAGR